MYDRESLCTLAGWPFSSTPARVHSIKNFQAGYIVAAAVAYTGQVLPLPKKPAKNQPNVRSALGFEEQITAAPEIYVVKGLQIRPGLPGIHWIGSFTCS